MNIKSIRLRVSYPFKKIIAYANYMNKNYKEVIWLIGDVRSGTTWVSNLINHENKYRTMFEPFHPNYIYRKDAKSVTSFKSEIVP